MRPGGVKRRDGKKRQVAVGGLANQAFGEGVRRREGVQFERLTFGCCPFPQAGDPAVYEDDRTEYPVA
jgi:hypothetical protein